MNIKVDLNEVKEFVESDKFVNFLITNSTNLGTPAFVLQALLEKIDEYEKGNNK